MNWLFKLFNLRRSAQYPPPSITAEEVREAITRNNLQLVSGDFGDLAHLACPVSAIARDRAGANTQRTAVNWANCYYGRDYINGFTCGFDGRELLLQPPTSAMSRGYHDGQRCRGELADLLPELAEGGMSGG